jgi:anionic cell wall polymer biosynthesis LytR-Cps2A-Psr (LCP) family protein
VQLPKQRMDLQRIHRQQEMLTRVLERFGMVAP